MKHLLFALTFIVLAPAFLSAQEFDPEKIYVIEMNDGSRFSGKIVSSDSRDIVVRTADRGDIALPKYSIKSIRDFEEGDDQYQDLFATRYFISTNGIPIREGESYINWTLLGPDIQFGYKDNVSLGLLTTWWASPVLFSAKRSFDLGDKRSAAIGVLGGGTLWQVNGSAVILPYASYTLGDRKANFTSSGGVVIAAGQGESFSRMVVSFAGMNKITRNGTFVFDSMIFLGEQTFAYIIPGVRLQTEPNKAFQFGFGGVLDANGSFPVPFVSWFRAF